MRSRLPLLLLLIAVAAVLRFVGLDFSLDLEDPRRSVLNINVDEQYMVLAVLDRFLHGDFDPGPFVVRGSACFYLFGAVAALIFGVPALFRPDGWSEMLADLAAQPAPLYLVLRGVSAAAGVLAVLVLYRMTRRELGERAGLLAGALAAVSYLPVRLAHMAVTDVVFDLVLLFALDRMLCAARDPSPRRFLMSGIWAGAATGVKYFGGVLGLPLVITWFVARSRASRVRTRDLALALLGTAVGFVLFSPNALVMPVRIIDALGFQSGMLIEPSAPRLLSRLAFHLEYSLAIGVGETALMAALVGLALGWRRGGTTRLLVFFPVLLLPTLLIADAPTVRFALPVASLLCVPAALALDVALRQLWRPLGVLLVVATLLPSLVRSVALDAVWLETDTRSDMLEWVDELDVRPIEVFAVGGHGLPRPLDMDHRLFLNAFLVLLEPDGAPRIETALRRRPRYILWEYSSSMPEPELWPFDLAEIVQRDYREIRSVDGWPGPERFGPVDRGESGIPGIFVPYGAPWRVERPGPGLALYERR